MTLPVFLFGLIIALLIGFLFHVLRGGRGLRLLLYLGLSILGFAFGQWISMARGWNLYLFGVLDLGMGLVGSVLVLGLSEWLSLIDRNK